ncbi:MAG TPA: ComEA family DNA-binding protein [Anaerolineales bacterium]|nr:ComEA family DNA-binding protein [Anaerolineales bacterium]
MLAQGGRFLFGLLTGLLAAGLLFLLLAEPRGSAIELLPLPTVSPLRVHVAGAVRRPGIVELPPGAIIDDALTAAGGALPGADLDSLNLAAVVEAGQRILVPLPGTAIAPPAEAAAAPAGTLDLNRASAADLESLPGIGPSLASAIVQYRDQNGPFRSVEDLLNVPGIGPTRLAQLRSLVSIE